MTAAILDFRRAVRSGQFLNVAAGDAVMPSRAPEAEIRDLVCHWARDAAGRLSCAWHVGSLVHLSADSAA